MQGTITHALKEWAIAINALEASQTIMLLRKGGIQEIGGCFHVAHQQVLLYPTYEHQQPFLLKPEYANFATPVTPGWRKEKVCISSWAEITNIFPVTSESVVNALQPFHIWNEYFISDRLKWKARQPLYILLLRTYKLPQIHEIPYREGYGGCKSWIDLTLPIDVQDTKPVLSESTYTQLVGEIQSIVGDKLCTSSV